MPLAPILSQSPDLDIYGNFAKGQQMGILKNQDARAQAGEERAQAGEDRAQTLFSQEQSDREKMQGILETMGSGARPEKIASALMASGNIKAANEVLDLAKGQRQVQGYDLENALMQQTQRNKKYEEQIRAEVGLTNNAISAIDGIVDMEEKEKVLDDYLGSIDIVNQQRSKAGLAPVVIPDAIKSGDIESRVNLLQGIARNGNMQLDMINRTKPEDMTAEIRNFMYGQANPEFAEQQRLEGEGKEGETTKLVKGLIEEGSAKNKKEALEILKGGAGATGRLQSEIDLGRMAETEKAIGTETGKAQGIAIAEYEDFVAALPGLEEVAGNLLNLSEGATYTEPGKFKDWASRQVGLDVGDAAEARAELIATIDVEVLPLLRPTFGAQFTVKEGEWLKATLMSPEASPQEKTAQLRARVRGWKRQAEKLARRTGESVPDGMFENVNKNLGLDKTEDDLSTLSDEELSAIAGGQ